jgi:hypothetical protein
MMTMYYHLAGQCRFFFVKGAPKSYVRHLLTSPFIMACLEARWEGARLIWHFLRMLYSVLQSKNIFPLYAHYEQRVSIKVERTRRCRTLFDRWIPVLSHCCISQPVTPRKLTCTIWMSWKHPSQRRVYFWCIHSREYCKCTCMLERRSVIRPTILTKRRRWKRLYWRCDKCWTLWSTKFKSNEKVGFNFLCFHRFWNYVSL